MSVLKAILFGVIVFYLGTFLLSIPLIAILIAPIFNEHLTSEYLSTYLIDKMVEMPWLVYGLFIDFFAGLLAGYITSLFSKRHVIICATLLGLIAGLLSFISSAEYIPLDISLLFMAVIIGSTVIGSCIYFYQNGEEAREMYVNSPRRNWNQGWSGKASSMRSRSRGGVNPILSIWLNPRATLRRVLSESSEISIVLLALMSGYDSALSMSSLGNAGDQLDITSILLGGIVSAIFLGGLFVYLGALILKGIGVFLDGTATLKEIRFALAWSAIPNLFSLVLFLISIMYFGVELFRTNSMIIESNIYHTIWLFTFVIVGVVTFIWSKIILLICLSEVQGYSLWKAFLNVLIPWVIVGGAFGLLMWRAASVSCNT